MVFRLESRLFHILAALLFVCFVGSAAAAPLRAQSEGRRHFLWAVEGRKATVYILGSIHLLREDSYPLPEKIESIYSCCNTFVFETDLDGMKRPEAQHLMMKLGMYPAGQTLSNNIASDTYALLSEKLRSSGIPIERFGQFRPWFVALHLANLTLERMGFDPAIGVDRHFYDRAMREKKEMVFLETNEFQINLFGRLDRQRQEFLLRQTLEELDIIESRFEEMITAWRTGDYEQFHGIMSESFNEYPSIYAALFTKRNRNWISAIRKLMNRRGDSLMIVGAGHLVGKDSVIDLLKKKGYTVRQL